MLSALQRVVHLPHHFDSGYALDLQFASADEVNDCNLPTCARASAVHTTNRLSVDVCDRTWIDGVAPDVNKSHSDLSETSVPPASRRFVPLRNRARPALEGELTSAVRAATAIRADVDVVRGLDRFTTQRTGPTCGDFGADGDTLGAGELRHGGSVKRNKSEDVHMESTWAREAA